jgi:hypothetical protein
MIYELMEPATDLPPANLPAVPKERWRELGDLLAAIHRGDPANLVFRQNEKRKPKRDTGFDHAICYVYMYTLACGPIVELDYAGALAAVRDAVGLQPPRATATINDIVKKHRKDVLEYFTKAEASSVGRHSLRLTMYAFSRAWPPGTPESGEGSVLDRIDAIPLIPGGHIDALREYFRKKTAR